MTGKRQQNRGKLWDRYTNSSKSKVSRSEKRSVKDTCLPSGTLAKTSQPQFDIEDMETSRLYLLYRQEKTEDVQEHWKKTFQYRQQYFLDNSGNISEILQEWPIICKPYGAELVSNRTDMNVVYYLPKNV